jgi:hypothetical protein
VETERPKKRFTPLNPKPNKNGRLQQKLGTTPETSIKIPPAKTLRRHALIKFFTPKHREEQLLREDDAKRKELGLKAIQLRSMQDGKPEVTPARPKLTFWERRDAPRLL